MTTVVGLGVVGLPTAITISNSRSEPVVGIDIDETRINSINTGNIVSDPLFQKEPNFSREFFSAKNRGFFATRDTFYLSFADVVVVCIGLDIDQRKQPEREKYLCALSDIMGYIGRYTLVIIETTLPPGMMRKEIIPLFERRSNYHNGQEIDIVYSPERITVGRIFENLRTMPRVIGSDTESGIRKAVAFYKPISPFLNPTDTITAEMVKVVENSYRDMNIAFANEIALICDDMDIDVLKVRDLVNALPNTPEAGQKNPVRNMHIPGSGVGGYCLPKDPWLLWSSWNSLPNSLYEFDSIIAEARLLNESIPDKIVRKVLGKVSSDKPVLVLGRTLVSGSADVRHSVGDAIVAILKSYGRKTLLFDPDLSRFDIFPRIEEVSAIILATEHSVYETLFPPHIYHTLLSRRYIILTEDLKQEVLQWSLR